MHEFSPLLYIGEKCEPEVRTLSDRECPGNESSSFDRILQES